MNFNFAKQATQPLVINRMLHNALQLSLLLALAICSAGLARSQGEVKPVKQPKITVQEADPLIALADFKVIYYQNGPLKLEAYLYLPAGAGPFPLVIYNHGSRAGNEQKEKPFQYVADMLKANGYAVLVPERRGYGKSEGATFTAEVGSDKADLMMKRFREEASDVFAGFNYLRTGGPSSGPIAAASVIDFDHTAIMGWSHGGVVSVLTASKHNVFTALIDQAGGALTWNGSATIRAELPDAASKIKAASLCLDAENDATTNSVKEVGQAIKAAGTWERTIIYPPFTPSSNPSGIPPGHLIFSAEGMPIWQSDVLTFLHNHI